MSGLTQGTNRLLGGAADTPTGLSNAHRARCCRPRCAQKQNKGDLHGGQQSGISSVAMAAITSQLDVAYNLSSLCRQALSADEGEGQVSQVSQPANKQSGQDRIVTQGQPRRGEAQVQERDGSFLTEVPTGAPSEHASSMTPPPAGTVRVAAPGDVSSSSEARARPTPTRSETPPDDRSPTGSRGGAQTTRPPTSSAALSSEVAPGGRQPAGVPMQQRLPPSGPGHAAGRDGGERREFSKENDRHEGDAENGGAGGGQQLVELEDASPPSRGQVEDRDGPAEENTPLLEEAVPSSWSSMVSLGQDDYGENLLEEETVAAAAVPPEEIPSSWSSMTTETGDDGRAGEPPSPIPEESSTWSGYISEFQPATPPETTLAGLSAERGVDVVGIGVGDLTGEELHARSPSVAAAATGTFRDDEVPDGETPGALARKSASTERLGRTAMKPTTSPKDDERVQPHSYRVGQRGADERGPGLSGEGVGEVTNIAREGSHGGGGGRHGGIALDSEHERDSGGLRPTVTMNADRGAGSGDTDAGRSASPKEGVRGGRGGGASRLEVFVTRFR